MQVFLPCLQHLDFCQGDIPLLISDKPEIYWKYKVSFT